MFDPDSQRDRIIQATLSLAAGHDWQSITMASIAAKAETTLAETRTHFATRADILKAFSAAVDKAVLTQMADDGEEGGVARDRLFDTLMTRFEILEPYKPALRRFNHDALRNPVQSLGMGFDLAPAMLNAQRWMLEAAGISTSGAAGRARLLGTSAIFTRVVQTWLDDDDAGLAKTMAALDSRLRRGEKAMRRVDDACSLVSGLANVIFSRRAPRSKPSTESAAPSAGTEPA
jgi:AcrR family transcriptional regulator